MISIKLKKADAPTYVEYFDMLPTWDSLTFRIAERYHIPTQDIAVGYLDNSTQLLPLCLRTSIYMTYPTPVSVH